MGKRDAWCVGVWGNARFAATVAVIVFVLISGLEIRGIFFLDLRIGHVVADARVEFIEGFPLELVPFLGEVCGCGDGALKG